MRTVIAMGLVFYCAAQQKPSTPQPEIFGPGIFSTSDFDTHIEFSPD